VECESPECKAELVKQITDVGICCDGIGNKLDGKLGLRNFGIAAACLCAPIIGYLIGLNVMVANCADETEVKTFEKQVVEQVTEIKGAVAMQAKIFEQYMKRTERRDEQQEKEIRDMDKRLNKLEP